MSRLDRLKKLALEKALKPNISEGRIRYPDDCNERMAPQLEKQLRERKHSLGNHPIFPDSDEMHFEEKILSRRFKDVVDSYKRHFDVNEVSNVDIISSQMQLIPECMEIESKYKKDLEELACEMIRKEYDMGEDDVEIIAELTPNITLEGIQKNPSPVVIEDMEFDNHSSLKSASDEVYKRRFINAMTQGAAKKGHHMFHLFDKELSKMNPTLPNKYAKLMSSADLSYLTNDDSVAKSAGGRVNVDFKDGKPVIHAQGMVFPVLVHELVKGVMEILSLHALPEDDKLTEYVLGKADFMDAEPWDMRLGPALWEQFTDCIDADDFDKKHHIYMDLISLPPNEFNHTMREVMLGSKEGKSKIKEITNQINEDIAKDVYNEKMNEIDGGYDDTMGFDDLDGIDFTGLM